MPKLVWLPFDREPELDESLQSDENTIIVMNGVKVTTWTNAKNDRVFEQFIFPNNKERWAELV